jgi:O-antigen/teichoic acid export membrane protein
LSDKEKTGTGTTPAADDQEAIRALSSSRTVAKSALWNLVGRAGPLLVAVFATPYLVRDLGASRWGVFTIALSLVGIFGMFDFGIGRSLTRTIAEMLTENRVQEAAGLARSGMAVLLVLGAIGGSIMAVGAHAWVYGRLQIPADLQTQVLHAFYVLCFSAPVVLLSSALWGVIAAYQRFREANLVNVPIMAMYYLGPLAILPFSNSLVSVLCVLVLCRIIMVVAYARICLRAMPELRHARAEFSKLMPVLRMGGWMTASNVTWPILTYMDRFIIASVLSAAATGYYSTPFDLVLRFSIVPTAIMNTAYPAMAASYRNDPENTQALFRRSIITVSAVLFPACLLCVVLSHWILTLWLGAEFAAHSWVVLRWLGVGILLTSVDNVVGGLLDGIGRASVNAKFSIVELLLYAPLLAYLVHRTGIEGAAIAWAARCLVDICVRLTVAQHVYAPIRPAVKATLPLLTGITAVLTASALVHGRLAPALVAVGGSCGVALLVWRSLTHGERTRLLATAGRLLPSAGRS